MSNKTVQPISLDASLLCRLREPKRRYIVLIFDSGVAVKKQQQSVGFRLLRVRHGS